MDEEELKKMREADAVASGLFGGSAFRPIGQTISSVGRAIASGQNPSMMAGAAGVNPLVSANVPDFPSRLGPLIRTDYGLPPSERPEYRTPEMMWDATKLGPAAPTAIQRWAATPFRGNEATARAQQFQGLPAHLQASVDKMNAPKEQASQVATSAPQPAKKAAIQTPYGMVYATVGEGNQVGQIQNDRAFDGNTPFWRSGEMKPQSARMANIGEQAQRSAAVNQMRERGAELAQQRFGAQESFFAQRRAERGALAVAESAARASGVRPMDIMRARETVAGPSSIAGIQRQSAIGPMSPVPTTVARFAGALPTESARMSSVSTSPYSNERSQRRSRTRRLAAGRGMQPAYSLPIQEAQEDYFRRQGMM
jgi:hypothetical protein